MFLYLVCGILFLSYSASCQCLQEAGGRDPPFEGAGGNVIQSGTTSGTLAIIPTYMFNCCANITRWQTYVQPEGPGHRNGAYSVGFQVWRPSDSDSECYSQVGQNLFLNVMFPGGGEINQLVSPSDYITVQPGDVVGLFIASRMGSNDGIRLDESPEFNSNTVWSNAADAILPFSGSCLYRLGDLTSGQLTMSTDAAPMLKVTLSEFPCPTIGATILTSEMTSTGGSEDINRNSSPEQPIGISGTSGTSGIIAGTSSTTAINTAPEATGGGTTGIIAGVVVSVVAIVASLLILIVGVLVWKRILSRRRKSEASDTQNLELSNPNYTYEAGISRREELANVHDERTLYHVAGPQVGGIPQPTGKYGSTTFPSQHLATDNNERDFVVGGVYDEPHFDSAVYADPTLPSFRKQDTRQNMSMFEAVGYYVPTLEERTVEGLKIYESIPNNNYNQLTFFVEDQIYWAPANTASDLYSQLASRRYREIARYQIRLGNPLGSGQFGEVYKATWSIDQHELEIAVKTLKSGASEEDQVKFLQEAAIMGQFSHTNVIKMYGVVTLGEPVLICAEILENGDLKSYLQKLELTESKDKGVQSTFLKFAKDIAAGMDYLSRKSFVHRDLAARNILLGKHLTCKVADFGMARDLMDDTYYTSSGGKIPVKWTAPEALLYKKYSTDSDVWSYGMVLFEIWTMGKKPFSNLTNPQVLRLMQTGYCQSPPPGCPRAIYQLMVDCWNPDHQSRPSFSTISHSYFKKSSTKLLHWASENDHLSSQVGVCGAPLHEAERLYSDLQYKYEGCQNI